MNPDQLRRLSGEALRREAKRADAKVGEELTRVRAHDQQFREAIDYALLVEDEQLRRKNTLRALDHPTE